MPSARRLGPLLMFGQSFSSNDLLLILTLVGLEALLSADNALILALMVKHLPKHQQRKALMYGLGGAFVLRSTAIVLAAYLIGLWWIQLLGAAYLIYLPVKHFRKHAGGGGAVGVQGGFWPTVVRLELVDIAFAIDSVIVAVAVVNTAENPDKVWVVIAGAVLGLVILRFAAGYFIRLLERFPALDHMAYMLVGWAGIKLALIAGHSFEQWWNAGHKAAPLGFSIPQMPTAVFWTGMAIIASAGAWYAVRQDQMRTDAGPESSAEAFEEPDEAAGKPPDSDPLGASR